MKFTIEKARKQLTANENKIADLRKKTLEIKEQIKQIKSENADLERFVKNYELLEQKFNEQMEEKSRKGKAAAVKVTSEEPSAEESKPEETAAAAEPVEQEEEIPVEENQKPEEENKDSGSVYDSIFK